MTLLPTTESIVGQKKPMKPGRATAGGADDQYRILLGELFRPDRSTIGCFIHVVFQSQ